MMLPNKPNPNRREIMKPAPSFYNLSVRTGAQFKSSPKMMAEFTSYEQYVNTLNLIIDSMKRVDEIRQAEKVEPVEPWEIPVKRMGDENKHE